VKEGVQLEIAGIQFAICSRTAAIDVRCAASYRQFWVATDGNPAGIAVHVDLRLDGIPNKPGLTMVFDGQSWLLFADGQTRYLALRSRNLDQPRWLAQFSLIPENVTVYCSQASLNKAAGHPTVSNPVEYPLDQLLLMYVLAHERGLLIHAAGAAMGGRGFLFAGASSAGKTTLSRQLMGHSGARLLSDDRMVVRKIGAEFRAFGTPWPGEAGAALNESMPLSAIFFLSKSPHNQIRKLDAQQALSLLLPVASILWYERELVPPMLAFCEDLLYHIPCFELRFKPGAEVTHMLSEFDPARSGGVLAPG
jgi:hypothetical protein